jgi:hypothetical protein
MAMSDDQEESIIQLLAEESDRLAESTLALPSHALPSNSGLCAWDQDSCSSLSLDDSGAEEELSRPEEVRSQPEVEEREEWEEWGRRDVDQSLRTIIKPVSSSASQLKQESHKRLLESVVSGGSMEVPRGKSHVLRLYKSNALSEKPYLHPLKPRMTRLEPGKIRRRSDAYDDSPSTLGSGTPLHHPQDRFW